MKKSKCKHDWQIVATAVIPYTEIQDNGKWIVKRYEVLAVCKKCFEKKGI